MRPGASSTSSHTLRRCSRPAYSAQNGSPCESSCRAVQGTPWRAKSRPPLRSTTAFSTPVNPPRAWMASRRLSFAALGSETTALTPTLLLGCCRPWGRRPAGGLVAGHLPGPFAGFGQTCAQGRSTQLQPLAGREQAVAQVQHGQCLPRTATRDRAGPRAAPAGGHRRRAASSGTRQLPGGLGGASSVSTSRRHPASRRVARQARELSATARARGPAAGGCPARSAGPALLHVGGGRWEGPSSGWVALSALAPRTGSRNGGRPPFEDWRTPIVRGPGSVPYLDATFWTEWCPTALAHRVARTGPTHLSTSGRPAGRRRAVEHAQARERPATAGGTRRRRASSARSRVELLR
jgi:hypothetical protein